jgi:hypothetical protein
VFYNSFTELLPVSWLLKSLLIFVLTAKAFLAAVILYEENYLGENYSLHMY